MSKWKPPAWLDEDLMRAMGGVEMVVQLMSTPVTSSESDPVGYARQMAVRQEITLLGRLHDEHRLIEPTPPSRFCVGTVTRYAVMDRENGYKVVKGWFGIEQTFTTEEEAEDAATKAEALTEAMSNLGVRR